uniref:Uncharacterized protein n=1 Tax=Oryza rufipogon TaxID=4529 RepID=A0A0E0Q7D6_ORYRU
MFFRQRRSLSTTGVSMPLLSLLSPGINQTQGRSAAPGTPRLDAYSGRSFTILSTSTARHTVSSQALCDPSRSAATHESILDGSL